MWNATKVDLAVNTTTIVPTPSIIKGIYINTTMSAHTCSLNNGSNTLLIIPASLVAGTVIDFAGSFGVLFDVNLIVDPDDSATGSLTIFYTDRTN